MTTGQRGLPALRISDEELARLTAVVTNAYQRMGEAVAPFRQAAERLVLGPEQTPAPLPPLAELVTDEDVQAAWSAYFAADSVLDAGPASAPYGAMRAALEAYGARLVARLGRTP